MKKERDEVGVREGKRMRSRAEIRRGEGAGVGGGAHRQRPGRKASTSLSCSPSGEKTTWEKKKTKRYELGWLQRWTGPEEKKGRWAAC
jgi:hypothetical protein